MAECVIPFRHGGVAEVRAPEVEDASFAKPAEQWQVDALGHDRDAEVELEDVVVRDRATQRIGLLGEIEREVDGATTLPQMQVDIGAVAKRLARKDHQSTVTAKLVQSSAQRLGATRDIEGRVENAERTGHAARVREQAFGQSRATRDRGGHDNRADVVSSGEAAVFAGGT